MEGEKFIPKEYLLEGEKIDKQPAETGEVKIKEEIEKLKQKKIYKEGSFLRRNLKKITAILAPLGIGIGVIVGEWKYRESGIKAENIAREKESLERERKRKAEKEQLRLKDLKEMEDAKLWLKEQQEEREKLRQERITPYQYTKEKIDNFIRSIVKLQPALGNKYISEPMNCFLLHLEHLVTMDGNFIFNGKTADEIIKRCNEINCYDEIIKECEWIDENTAEQMNMEALSYEGWEGNEKIEQMIKSIIKYTLPEAWEKNIGKVILDPRAYLSIYPEAENPAAQAIGGDYTEKGDIKFFQEHVQWFNEETKRAQLVEIIIHEILHECDPIRLGQEIALGTQIEGSAKILEFVKSAKERRTWPAFKGIAEKVEAWKTVNNESETKAKQMITIMEMGDWFAYLDSSYLIDPDSPELYADEREFFDWYFKTAYPDFNVKEAAKNRQKIMAGGEIHKVGNEEFIVPPQGKTWEDLGIEE